MWCFGFFGSSSQSPVLGESVSMCSPSDDNPNFYKDLMVKSHDALLWIFHRQIKVLLAAVPLPTSRWRQRVFLHSIHVR